MSPANSPSTDGPVRSTSAPRVPVSSTAAPPIPDHELLRRIGQGSYGEVWLARTILCTGKDRKDYPALPPDLRERPASEQRALLELKRLTLQIETVEAERVRDLSELARLRRTTLSALMTSLGLPAPGYA